MYARRRQEGGSSCLVEVTQGNLGETETGTSGGLAGAVIANAGHLRRRDII